MFYGNRSKILFYLMENVQPGVSSKLGTAMTGNNSTSANVD